MLVFGPVLAYNASMVRQIDGNKTRHNTLRTLHNQTLDTLISALQDLADCSNNIDLPKFVRNLNRKVVDINTKGYLRNWTKRLEVRQSSLDRVNLIADLKVCYLSLRCLNVNDINVLSNRYER